MVSWLLVSRSVGQLLVGWLVGWLAHLKRVHEQRQGCV